LEEYLARRFYPKNAEKYLKRLVAACYSLGSAPFRGTKRDDLAEGMRMVGFERRATIYFKVSGQQVLILGVFYGGHQPDGLL
jgi:toxin ParE1/3/4